MISYGCSARTSLEVVERARERGMKVGFLRLITLWPFCENKVRELAGQVEALVMPEMN